MLLIYSLILLKVPHTQRYVKVAFPMKWEFVFSGYKFSVISAPLFLNIIVSKLIFIYSSRNAGEKHQLKKLDAVL
jgi:hypothetical protein